MGLDLDVRKAVAAAGLAGAMLLSGGSALAQEVDTYEETPPPEVIDDQVQPPAVEDVDQAPAVAGDEEVAGDQAVRSGATLPVTGGDALGLAAIGAGAMAIGGATLLYRRRRFT